jgi:thiamine-phosphate pyrophosphorylase
MRDLRRILDANANRAREAVRVMEEAARFLLDDADLAGQLKQLRHDLAAALAPLGDLPRHRDTPGDVGTAITTASETRRADVPAVAVAAGKRLSEALRAIEEYAKAGPEPAVAGAVEPLRYRGYDLEARLIAALGSGRPARWRLCLLLSERLCGRPWRDTLAAALAGGVDCVQVREKQLDGGDLKRRVDEVLSLARPAGASVIVNDRPDVALAAGADGVHLGQTDLPCVDVRRLVGRQLIVGVSTCRLEDADAARAAGADYCGVGPMFATTTKHKPDLAGPAYLRQYLAWGKLPHLAIGGITPANIDQLAAIGVHGVAVSSAICCAQDPEAAARSLCAALDRSAAEASDAIASAAPPGPTARPGANSVEL